MADKVRVRFAPSPTGYLHLGGARTALFNWLYARHHQGVFVLRIEDTDQVRSTPASVDAILQGMEWLGLNWDEGPIFQSQRLARYREVAERLVAEHKAYPCICSPEELEQRRKEQMDRGENPRYDERCRHLEAVSPGMPFAIRFKAPSTGETVIEDAIRGPIVFQNKDVDDFIIQRSDGLPTYNFAVVVDDVDMAITLVMRGDDHISNTPKQILLYQVLGTSSPQFAHIPMILGPDRQRLSKRHGATSVIAYRDMGFLPEALVNYLVRLGWSHKDQEIFSREEMIELFTLDKVSKTAAVFDTNKLEWLNAQYLKRLSPAECLEQVQSFWEARGTRTDGYDNEHLAAAVATLQERSKTLVALAEDSRFYFAERMEYDPEAAVKWLKPEVLPVFRSLRDRLANLGSFERAIVEEVFRSLADELGVKAGTIIQPCRVAVTGRSASPGMFEILEIMGRERTLKRLDDAIKWLNHVPA